MMILFLFVLFGLCLYGVRFSNFHKNYLGIPESAAIRGIFIFCVFLSHGRGYIGGLSGITNQYYLFFLSRLGQLMVAMFLFLSGFGVAESFQKKAGYLGCFLQKRILKTLLHFDLALVFFLIMNLILEIEYPLSTYILCWIGWESIGNSNWFIFDILLLYSLSYICIYTQYSKRKENENSYFEVDFKTLCSITILTGIAWIILFFAKYSQSWWYNTLLCYPAGMWYSHYKERIDGTMCRTEYWFLALALVVPAFLFLYRMGNQAAYTLCACLFCLILCLLCMKIRIENAPLRWLGEHLFEIYILQRIPFTLLQRTGLSVFPFILTFTALILTVAMACFFHYFLSRLDRIIFVR